MEHELLRKKLWMRVASAYVSSSNSTSKEEASIWANQVLKDFDRKFIPSDKMTWEKAQKRLVNEIKRELASQTETRLPDSYFHSVWFEPSAGRFLYGDEILYYEIEEPLIKNKTLVFKAMEKHQGIDMLRYVLS